MVKKDDEGSVSSETKGPLKSFQALMGEGEKFSRDKLYTKAIQCYTEALDLLPQDDDKATPKDINDRLQGLVARSACYLKIGKNDLALQDAEESLKSNKEYTKGLYQKAEALYAMGEFELALMFYHRGKKLRSDLREFQLGINKAQEAIDNSVGDPNRVKLEASGDLSIFYKNDEKKKQPVGYVRASQKKELVAQRKQHAPMANPKTTKQLLGDLYDDRAYLESLINDNTVTKQNTKSGDAIYQLASDGLDYLDSRTDFWRQQEPLYARPKMVKRPEGDDEPLKHIRRELEAIDELQNMDQFSDARRRAHRLHEFCDRLDERKHPEKYSVLADVYSRLGNAYLELGDYAKSLDYHNRDLKIAETRQLSDRQSRALDNLGRVYARNGQFPQAIQVWERKIPLASSSLEKAWLFHEIGQCHFGLGDYERSKEYGERSFVEAVETNDPVWQLNAKVLVAHSQTKLRQYREAEKTFDQALVLAKDQNDVAAERAIERAAKDVRDQIDKGAADSPPDRAEVTYDIKVKSSEPIVYGDNEKGSIRLTIFGDNGSSGPIELRADEGDTSKAGGLTMTLKRKALDAGKITKISLICHNIESWSLDSIEIQDNKRRSKHKFPSTQIIDSKTRSIDLFQEGYIVAPAHVSKVPTNNVEKKSKTSVTPTYQQPAQNIRKSETKPSETKPSETKPSETKPSETKPSETKPSETKPSSARTNDSNKKSSKTDDQKPPKKEDTIEKKPAETPVVTQRPPDETSKKIDYCVIVQTGSVVSAGTDANVFISLHGDKNKIVRHPLKKPTAGWNPFERGQKDEFEFSDIDIGQLKTITIEHDNGGMGSGWYLENIVVKLRSDTITFPVERWLDVDEDDKRISLDLEPGKKPASQKKPDEPKKESSAVEYEITVKTGDKRGAGTDANVYLSLIGDNAKVEREKLHEALDGKVNKFESGSTDRFQIYALDIGKLKSIRIEHDGTGIGAGWYVDSIEVRHISRNETYRFPVDRWLDVGEGDKRISLDLEPDKKPGHLKEPKK